MGWLIEVIGWPARLPWQVDWEAWATLLVGIAAVRGARAIGLRQVTITEEQTQVARRQAEILDRQAAIAESQVDLERTKLRADLYEQRNKIFSAINEYGAKVGATDDPIPQEELNVFLDAWAASRFLFGPEVEQIASGLWQVSLAKRNDYQRMQVAEDHNQEERRDELVEKIMKHYDKLHELMEALEQAMHAYLGMAEIRAMAPRA